MARHFWEGQLDPEADLSEAGSYLKPLEPDEFADELFDSLSPSTPIGERTEPIGEPTLLREHQLEPDEFARRALEHPEMWDKLDHQYLQDVLEGAEANEDLERLADDWLSGRADERARLAAGPVELPLVEEDLGGPGEGFDDHIDELEEEAVAVSLPTPELEEPLDLSKVDEWWKKK